jgi:3-deoxy-D-manno-octulosonic-acid transferase
LYSRKIVCIRTSSIGDVVLASACITFARLAGVSVIWIGREPTLTLLRGCHPDIHFLEFNYRRNASQIQQLLGGNDQIGAVVDLQVNLPSSRLTKLLKAKDAKTFKLCKRRGIRALHLLSAQLRGRFFSRGKTPKIQDWQWRQMVDLMGQAMEAIGVPQEKINRAKAMTTPSLLGLKTPTEPPSWYHELKNNNWIAIAPGASYFTKQAPESLWIDLLNHLHKSDPLLKVVSFGSEADRIVATKIFDGVNSKISHLNLAGKLSLTETTLAIQTIRLLVTNDSGLLHIAEACQIPVVALFGPTAGELGFSPRLANSLMASSKIGCRPCSKHGQRLCRYGDKLCFESIDLSSIVKFISTQASTGQAKDEPSAQKKTSRLLFMAVICYSLFSNHIIWPLLQFLSVFSDRIKRQLEGRQAKPAIAQLQQMASLRRKHQDCWVFFCSSAGEYEQAKPLIDRLLEREVLPYIFFHSKSGYEFARARHESMPYALTPMDTIDNWNSIFFALRPSQCIVVRHELWPAFIMSAQSLSQLALINAVPPAKLLSEPKFKTKISAWFKRLLLAQGNTLIYTVDQAGMRYFKDVVQLPEMRISMMGDTKFDRAIERVEQGRHGALSKSAAIRNHWENAESIIVAGSVHLPDVKLLLPAFKKMQQARFFSKLKLVLTPHDISSHNLAAIQCELAQSQLKSDLLSEVETMVLDNQSLTSDVILVDCMGRLAELYSLATLGFVGGAVHAKIHNALEPAAWHLPLTSGLKYQNSQEAKLLVHHGLLTPVSDHMQLASVWETQLAEREAVVANMKALLKSQSGSSDKLITSLLTLKY